LTRSALKFAKRNLDWRIDLFSQLAMFLRKQIENAIRAEERRIKNKMFLEKFGFSYDDYCLMVRFGHLFRKPINLEEVSMLKQEN